MARGMKKRQKARRRDVGMDGEERQSNIMGVGVTAPGEHRNGVKSNVCRNNLLGVA